MTRSIPIRTMLLLAAAFSLTGARRAEAQQFQYAAKFVIGKSDGTILAPGNYFTAINVHNPNAQATRFRKKFAIALPGEKPGRVTAFFDASLPPDAALEIDTRDIARHTDTAAGVFLKGFVVITSPVELDVVGVYTAAGATGQVETMHMERVPARRVAVTTGAAPDAAPDKPPATRE